MRISPQNLESMTSRQLLKLQSDISAIVARRHDEEIGKAQTAETRLRDELRADLAGLARKWETKVAESFPGAKAAPKGPNGHAKVRHARRGHGKVPVKYRDAEGHAWSGRGKQPRWLTTLVAAGAKREDFRVAA